MPNEEILTLLRHSYKDEILDKQFWSWYIGFVPWACGGMVDTLVLGTSAKAWEFESLHAQFNRRLDLLMNKSKGLFSS